MENQSKVELKEKMLKVWSRDRTLRKSVIASSFEELCNKVIQKFELADPLTFCLEVDGTEIDTDVFYHLAEGTTLIVLTAGESWITACAANHRDNDEHSNGGREEAMEARLGAIVASIKASKRGKPKKTTRRLHFGWVHYNFKERRFIQVRNAGQITREVDKNLTYTQAMELVKDVYFPRGKSEKGKLSNMVVTVGKIDGTRSDEDQVIEASVSKVYLQTKLNIKQATVYTDSDSDSDSDLYDPQLHVYQPPKKKLHLRKMGASGVPAAIGATRTTAATSSTSLEIPAVPGPSGVVTTIGYPAALQATRISATSRMTPVQGLSRLPTSFQAMSEVPGGSPVAAKEIVVATGYPTSSGLPGTNFPQTPLPVAVSSGASSRNSQDATLSTVPEQFTSTDTPTMGALGVPAAVGATRTSAVTSSPTSLEISTVPGPSGVVTTIGYQAALQTTRISATSGMTPVQGLSRLPTAFQAMSEVPGGSPVAAKEIVVATGYLTSPGLPGTNFPQTPLPAAVSSGISSRNSQDATLSTVPEQFTSTDTPTISFRSPEYSVCNICCERPLDASIDPCRHRMCLVCGLQIQALGQKCPICRGIIRNVVSLI